MINRWFAGVVFLCAALGGWTHAPIVAKAAPPLARTPATPSADDTARWLAGLPALNEHISSHITTSPAWRAHAAALSQLWSVSAEPARAQVREWVEARGLAAETRPVFYPFSGPDLLNALELFPASRDYLLIALEREGRLPRLPWRVTRPVSSSLKELRAYLAGHISRNFFITHEMSGKQGRAALGDSSYAGVTAVLLSSLALLGYEVLSYRAVSLSDDGDLLPLEERPRLTKGYWAVEVTGVEVFFRARATPAAPAGEQKRAVFLRGNLNDERLHKQRGLARHILKRGEVNTLVKAASYLMHMRGFDDIRSLILSQSHRVVMDDTAIPYRLIRERAEEWGVELFGEYLRPPPSSRTFSKHCQPDLRAAFKERPRAPLPFKFGYYVSQPHLLLLTRRAPAPRGEPLFDKSNRLGVEVFFKGAASCERGEQLLIRRPPLAQR